MPEQYVIPEHRNLTSAEYALLSALISRTADAERYRHQLARTTVVARCGCGCPTIDLALDGEKKRIVGPSNVIADVEARSPEGYRVGITLHVRTKIETGEDQLSELELISSEEVETFRLPSPESIDWSTNVGGG